jgi:pimeloyl-ACP methyl ester carboxylesterase
MAERMIQIAGAELCTEAFGDRSDPPVLLIMGIGGSMLWWDEAFCRRLADGGRFVLRYDHRDTGRSTTYEPGAPGYTSADMIADAAAVLDGYGIGAAHVVGLSAGGAFAQLLALDAPQRVASLVLISTSPATPGERHLPSPTAAFMDFARGAHVDYDDPASVVEYLVDYSRVLAGGVRPYDEAATRDLACREVARARRIASVRNHDAIRDGERTGTTSLSDLRVPTLVIHGTADPLFGPAHAEALAAEIPGAALVLLDGAGHGLDPADHATVAGAIIEHTGRAVTARPDGS